MNGWVYVLSNESIPDLVKVGYTDRDPVGRAKELSDTSVPFPFVVEYGALVQGAEAAERKAHGILAIQRVNKDREFFRCSVDEAIAAIRKVLGDEILFEGFCVSSKPEEATKNEISFPLIGLIRCLKEDCELTNHEIYLLGEWLNENPDACELWPGTELIGPLNEYYEDGKLSPDELNQISLLLQEIENQFKEKFKWHEPKDPETETLAVESNVEYEALRKRLEKITIEQRDLNISEQAGSDPERKDWFTALEHGDKNKTSRPPVLSEDKPPARSGPPPKDKDWFTSLKKWFSS